MFNKVKALRASYQSTKELAPVFDNVRSKNWYVSIGQALPDDQGLLVGGHIVPWPSPAHRAVWKAAQHGFTNAQYDDALRTNGLPVMVDGWTRRHIAFLAGACSIPFGRVPKDIANPSVTAIAGWSWRAVWHWDAVHNVFYNPQAPSECFAVPRVWHDLTTDFFALPPNKSIGQWISSWAFEHPDSVLSQPEFRTPLDAALNMLSLLMAASCFYGAGNLDHVAPEV